MSSNNAQGKAQLAKSQAEERLANASKEAENLKREAKLEAQQEAIRIKQEVEAENNFVYSDIPVALCGIEGVVVVIKNGRALIMKKGKSSLVRDVVKQMKNSNV